MVTAANVLCISCKIMKNPINEVNVANHVLKNNI